MKAGEKLFKFLARLTLEKFYGTVTIRFEHGKVTHVETATRRTWGYKDLRLLEGGQLVTGGRPACPSKRL